MERNADGAMIVGGKWRYDKTGTCNYHGSGISEIDSPGEATLGNSAHREVPEQTTCNVGGNGFWKRGTTEMFDARIVNLNAFSYLRIFPEKAPKNA